jgi:hypothetical protein
MAKLIYGWELDYELLADYANHVLKEENVSQLTLAQKYMMYSDSFGIPACFEVVCCRPTFTASDQDSVYFLHVVKVKQGHSDPVVIHEDNMKRALEFIKAVQGQGVCKRLKRVGPAYYAAVYS